MGQRVISRRTHRPGNVVRHEIPPFSVCYIRLRLLKRILLGTTQYVRVATPSKTSKTSVSVNSDWAGAISQRKSMDMLIATLCGFVVHASVKSQGPIAQSTGKVEMGGLHRGELFGINILNLRHCFPQEYLSLEVKDFVPSVLFVSLYHHVDVRASCCGCTRMCVSMRVPVHEWFYSVPQKSHV